MGFIEEGIEAAEKFDRELKKAAEKFDKELEED